MWKFLGLKFPATSMYYTILTGYHIAGVGCSFSTDIFLIQSFFIQRGRLKGKKGLKYWDCWILLGFSLPRPPNTKGAMGQKRLPQNINSLSKCTEHISFVGFSDRFQTPQDVGRFVSFRRWRQFQGSRKEPSSVRVRAGGWPGDCCVGSVSV